MSARWLFHPNSALESIDRSTTGKTHLTLLDAIKFFKSKKTHWKIWLGVVQLWLAERNHPKDQRELHFQDFFNSVQGFIDSDASLTGRTGSRLVRETLIIILFHPYTKYFRNILHKFFTSGQIRVLDGALV